MKSTPSNSERGWQRRSEGEGGFVEEWAVNERLEKEEKGGHTKQLGERMAAEERR